MTKKQSLLTGVATGFVVALLAALALLHFYLKV